MKRNLLFVALAAFFVSVSYASAANTINWTFYGPGAGGRMQGSMSAAGKDAEGGSNIIHTLDDVRTGKSKYVTLASASAMKGRYYCIGTVTYTSPPTNGGDGKTHTIENVVGYVHDTGCAFNGTCSCAFLAQYCDGRARTDKMDIAVGNFSGYDGLYASNYVTKNPNKAPASWTQIAGIPQQSSQTNALTPCGGQVKEDGTPVSAPYSPPPTLAPQNPLQQTAPSAYPTQMSQQPSQAGSAPTGGTAGNGTATVVGQAYTQPAYYSPVPQQGTTQTTNAPNSPILSSLFQQSSATSGIRTVQNAAQTIVDLFTVPATSATRVDTGALHPVPQTAVSNTPANDNVSLMTISQYDDLSTQAAPQQNQIVQDQTHQNPAVSSGAVVQQQNTFGMQPVEQTSPSINATTLGAMQAILVSFRTLLQSMLSLFTQR